MKAGAILLLLVLSCGGCGGGKRMSETAKLNQWLGRHQAELPEPEYRVEAPDVLLIVAPRIKELDLQKQAVRPDGCISLSLIGDVQVAGKTPEEIARRIRQGMARYYGPTLLDIRVQVAEFKSKVVYVFGQVFDPGMRPYTGKETLLGALAQARLNPDAWPERIVLIRPNDDATVRQKVTVDLKAMYRSGQVDRDFMLEEGDLIYVPPSPLAKLGMDVKNLVGAFNPARSLMFLAGGGI